MLQNAPHEPFSCVILYRYLIKLLTEKRNVLTQTFIRPKILLKFYFSTRYLSKAIRK